MIKNRDTKYTKLFVGGIPYESDDDALRNFFNQFGEIDEAVVIKDRTTKRSKGYGFVTMVTSDAAKLACRDKHPIIDGRQANVNLAYLGAKPKSAKMPGKLASPSPMYTYQPDGGIGPSPQFVYASPMYPPAQGPPQGPISPLSVLPPPSPNSQLAPSITPFQQPFYMDCNGNAVMVVYPVYEQYPYPPYPTTTTTYVSSPTGNSSTGQFFTFPTVPGPPTPPLNGINGTINGQQFFHTPPFEMVGPPPPQVQ